MKLPAPFAHPRNHYLSPRHRGGASAGDPCTCGKKESQGEEKEESQKAESGFAAAAATGTEKSHGNRYSGREVCCRPGRKAHSQVLPDRMEKHPAIRSRKMVPRRFSPQGGAGLSHARSAKSLTDEGELANLRKFRVGVEGYITKSFEYRVERELRNEIADWTNMRTRPTQALWRDVYGNWRYFRRVQIRAGQFKIPFGMDQLHHPEFVNRSLIGNFWPRGAIRASWRTASCSIRAWLIRPASSCTMAGRLTPRTHEYSGERNPRRPGCGSSPEFPAYARRSRFSSPWSLAARSPNPRLPRD